MDILNHPKIVKGDLLLKLIASKKMRFLRHIIVISSLAATLTAGKNWGEYRGGYDYADLVLSIILSIGVFYINIYILLPVFFSKGRLILYLLSLMATIVASWIIGYICHAIFFDEYKILSTNTIQPTLKVFIVGLIILTPIFLISTSIKVVQQWIYGMNKIHELENVAMQSELKALRNQIQPHFLFNMLNGIHVSIDSNPALAARLVLKLSNFLRYLLYESNENEVYLSSEIKFINDFLSLEKMRRDDFDYTLAAAGEEVMNIKVPSYIILTLAENAVKHSATQTGESWIKMSFTMEGKLLHIHCSNSVDPSNKLAAAGGLGLANLLKRLNLLYGSNFTLENSKTDHQFNADLKLPI